MNKTNNAGDFPQRLLEELDEHTSNGFVIFYTDKDGNSSFLPYTNGVTLAGLLSHAKAASIAFESNLLQQMMNLNGN
jgi:hypothetical protein